MTAACCIATGKAPAMIAILASTAIFGAGFAGIAAMAFTLRSQMGSIRQVLADARTLQQADSIMQDRQFLSQLTRLSDLGGRDVEVQATLAPASAFGQPPIAGPRRAGARAARQPVRTITPGRRAAA